MHGDELPSGLNYAVFDFGVNSGPSRAAKYLQALVGVSQDGKIGPQTIGAVWSKDPSDLINRLCDNRLGFMKRIRGGKLWKTFGRGWSRRVSEVRSKSLKMAVKAARYNKTQQGMVSVVDDVAAEGRVSTEKLLAGAGGATSALYAVNEFTSVLSDTVGNVRDQVPEWAFSALILAGPAVFGYWWYRRNSRQKAARRVKEAL